MTDAFERCPCDQAGLGVAQECAQIEADLGRLKSLIDDAGERLSFSFGQVARILPAMQFDEAQRAQVDEAVRRAVTALQFQDIAIQLTSHAQRRLAALEERLRSLSDEAAQGLEFVQSHPVRQAEMSAGSIDLF
jgi:hypothetical protein